MGKHKHHPVDEMVQAAVRRVAAEGTQNASDRDVTLAGFDWLADKLNTQQQTTSIFVRMKVPHAVTGGGGAAVVWAVLQMLTTGG